jgi:hypothetical protein
MRDEWYCGDAIEVPPRHEASKHPYSPEFDSPVRRQERVQCAMAGKWINIATHSGINSIREVYDL